VHLFDFIIKKHEAKLDEKIAEKCETQVVADDTNKHVLHSGIVG
jgi:hypothetical protein